jgi:hypothetical protein
MEDRIGKIEGILEQMRDRLSHIEIRLNNIDMTKADRWEIRIWFIILMVIVSLWSYVILNV